MSVISVRRLEPADWRLYRKLRLTALADAPYAFGSTLASEQAFADQRWRDRLSERTTLVAETAGVAVASWASWSTVPSSSSCRCGSA